MWQVERSEFWANLSGFGGSKSVHVGTANLPAKPKAGEIRTELNKLFADHGFRVTDLDLSMRSFGIITGDLERTEPETRALDEFHSDSFTMDWWPNRSQN